jgi:hypothetical protein
MAPKKGTTRPSGNIAKAPAPAAKSLPAPKSTGPKLPTTQSTGPKLSKAVQQYSSPIGPKAPSNKAQMMQRAQQMRKENEKNKGKGKGSGKGSGSGSNANAAKLPLDTGLDDNLDLGGGGGGGGGDYQEYSPVARSIKIPDRDAIIALQRDGADQALITAILFEQIGATELVKFTRNDTIDGLNGVYDVISNISELKTKLDPSYLISKQRPDVTIDNGFSIRLQDKLPSIDYLFENEIPNYVHFDSTIGDGGSLVIELDNLDTDEIIEVEIDTSGTIEEVRQ